MIKYLVVYASYCETEGLDASVLIFDTEEQAQQNLKESYGIVSELFKDGEIEWDDLDINEYSIGGYDRWSSHMRFEAYIDKKEVV